MFLKKGESFVAVEFFPLENLEDGVLCLYSHFIKEIKFMTQLQPACGSWIKKGPKRRRTKNEQTFMIN